MHPVLKKIADIPGFRACAPWLGFLVLNALFVAPGVALEVPERPYLLLQPSGDLLLLVLAGIASYAWRHGLWVRRAAVGLGVVLWAYSWDELVARSIVQQNPPLYDQLFLIRHLGVLVFDLWSWKMALGLIGAAITLGLLVVLGRLLLRATVQELAQRPWQHVAKIAGPVLVLVLVGTTIDQKTNSPRRHTWIHWVTPALNANLEASWKMYRSLQRGLDDSPYEHYASTYPLQRKPDVHLFLVESYGRMLISDPEAGPAWREQIEGIEARLTEQGWHSVSAFSRAPISGGRSWLAEATLLTGVFVQFEAVFQHLVADIDRTPNLVSYLDAQGYETMLLAPKDRPRPGVEDVNRYNYDRQVLALDLEYTGPRFGWGIIPDQYSLGFAHDNVFSKVDGPVFTNFHMVSSHAPWQMIPEFVDDWRQLNEAELPDEAPEQQALANPTQEFLSRVRRYQRRRPRYTYMGDADALKIDAYSAAIRYDLELLTRHLEGVEGDKIVIIMGDHQPPLLSSEDKSFDVPIHILARDPQLLVEFRAQGFVDGLAINSGREALIAHEGMFSLMVRALAQCCSEGSAGLPEYLPDGVRTGSARTKAAPK